MTRPLPRTLTAGLLLFTGCVARMGSAESGFSTTDARATDTSATDSSATDSPWTPAGPSYCSGSQDPCDGDYFGDGPDPYCFCPPGTVCEDQGFSAYCVPCDGPSTSPCERGPSEPPPSCSSIDVLFVVDNTATMAEEHAVWSAMAWGLIAGIRTEAGVGDIRAMVVDTDGSPTADACDERLGVGRRTDADGNACHLEGEGRFVLPNSQEVPGQLSCVLDVGLGGAEDERPVEAAVRAVTQETGARACNGAFLRDDALLVIVLVTDEDDDDERRTGKFCAEQGPMPGSAGSPEIWFNALATAKGSETNLAVIAFVGTAGGPCPVASACGANDPPNAAQPADNLIAFATMFTHHSLHPVCLPNPADAISEAAHTVARACRR